MPGPSRHIPELERIMREAGGIALADQEGAPRTLKPDGSLVTPADTKVELFLRQELGRLAPGAGVVGEEIGYADETAAGLWCVDPIDGTSNYAFGSPLWGISAGLVTGESVVLGAVYLPALGEMYSAAAGSGAFLNGRPLPRVPPGIVRPEELVSYPDRIMRMFPGGEFSGKMRHTGAFVVDAVFTCVQRYRGLVGLREKIYNVAASICIARELGANVRFADGSELTLEPLKRAGARLEKPWLIFPGGSGFRLV